MKTLHIPRIDISPIMNPTTEKIIRKETVRQIYRALEETGFMTITNHWITNEQMKKVFWTYKEFFDLPLEEKMKVRINNKFRGFVPLMWEQVNPNQNPDYKECYDSMLELWRKDEYVRNNISLYGPNQWPESMPHMKQVVNRYYHDACNIWSEVLEAIAEVLEVPGFFRDKFTKPAAMLRSNYYPPRREDATHQDFGIAAHTDYGCLTILAQDSVSGLEVKTKDAQWIPVKPQGDDIVVNVGEVLQKFTSGKLRATPHRVLWSSEERMSLPLFYNPNYDTPLIPIWVDRQDKSTLTTGEYIEGRYNSTYKK